MARKVKLKVSTRILRKKARRSSYATVKHCRFCANDAAEHSLDFKNAVLLRTFVTERGKILPSRISGNCARHQRQLTSEIKCARTLALLPFASGHR
jgi:small subunit ribosomal protein S18